MGGQSGGEKARRQPHGLMGLAESADPEGARCAPLRKLYISYLKIRGLNKDLSRGCWKGTPVGFGNRAACVQMQLSIWITQP